MREELLKIVYSVIDDINEERPEKKKIPRSEDAVLYGENGQLDSLGLVNLVVAIEQLIQDEYDYTISLSDEKAMSQKNSPFLNVSSLVNYIQQLLNSEN